jgi:hypothetical protein
MVKWFDCSIVVLFYGSRSGTIDHRLKLQTQKTDKTSTCQFYKLLKANVL